MALGRLTLVVSLVVLPLLATGARAQQPASQPAPPGASGWTFNIAPYLWLPQIKTSLNYDLPPALGGRLPTELSAGPGEYLPRLNFATMVSGDVRYDRFSILSDFMYMNVNVAASTIKSLDFFGLPSQPISRSLQLSATSRLTATIWTLAGGYTVLQGNWGNVDVFGGFRYAGTHANTDYSLALNVTGPRGNGATFGGVGGVSASVSQMAGIGGVRGRFQIADTSVFVPYYFDIGTGGSNLTWQVSSGVGYQFSWGSASVLYRYLAFDGNSHATIQRLTLGGPMLMATVSF